MITLMDITIYLSCIELVYYSNNLLFFIAHRTVNFFVAIIMLYPEIPLRTINTKMCRAIKEVTALQLNCTPFNQHDLHLSNFPPFIECYLKFELNNTRKNFGQITRNR